MISNYLLAAKGDPTKNLPQDELARFGNWTGQTDTKVMAADLKRRGLIGAQQLIEDTPNVNDQTQFAIHNLIGKQQLYNRY